MVKGSSKELPFFIPCRKEVKHLYIEQCPEIMDAYLQKSEGAYSDFVIGIRKVALSHRPSDVKMCKDKILYNF